MTETRLVADGLGFPESTRWRDGRVWLCNWGAGEVLAVTPDGRVRVEARVAPQTLPFSIDWLPDGRLVVVDGPQRRLVTCEPDGTVRPFADLTRFGPAPFNEVVVDEAGNAYVNGGPGLVVHVPPDGICADADGAVWVASVPGRGCVRVREGGEVLGTVAVDRGCFACTLGGGDGRTLYIAAAEWRGMEAAMRDGPGRTGRLVAAPGQP